MWLVSNLTGLDLAKLENMLLFVCSETVESKLVKQETIEICQAGMLQKLNDLLR